MTSNGQIEFRLVDPEEGRHAYHWHRGFAGGNNHVFPRNWDDYSRLADNGQIWCAKNASGDYLALAYFCFSEGHWEVGGLMTAAQAVGKGIGSTITFLTLGHVLFEENPLSRGEQVVMHVHAENSAPRKIVQDALSFHLRERIKVPGAMLPGLKVNEAGYVEGDEFVLTNPGTLDSLADWCESFDGTLRDGSRASVSLRPGTSLKMWAAAFRDQRIPAGPNFVPAVPSSFTQRLVRAAKWAFTRRQG